jgi:hypothetical protein
MPEDRQLTAPATLLDIMRDRAERYRDKVAFDYSTGAEEHSLLSDGVDAITEIPLDRWGADASGNANTRWGGFLDQVDQFDRFALVDAHACQRNQKQLVRQSKAGSALRMRAMAHCCHGGQRMVVPRSSR